MRGDFGRGIRTGVEQALAQFVDLVGAAQAAPRGGVYRALGRGEHLEGRSLEGLPTYNEEYFNRFYSQIGTTVMQQINAAAHAVGSYWYTAWLNAGRPSLPSR